METSYSKLNGNPSGIKKSIQKPLSELLGKVNKKEGLDLIPPRQDKSPFTCYLEIGVKERLLEKQRITVKVILSNLHNNQLIAECKTILKKDDPTVEDDNRRKFGQALVSGGISSAIAIYGTEILLLLTL